MFEDLQGNQDISERKKIRSDITDKKIGKQTRESLNPGTLGPYLPANCEKSQKRNKRENQEKWIFGLYSFNCKRNHWIY